MPRGAYLNGSLPVEDAKTAFRLQARTLGERLESMTDGEFGWRDQWIVGLVPKLLDVPGITMRGQTNPPNADPAYDGFPVLSVDRSVHEVPKFGYARVAIDSYLVFSTLQAKGAIPADVKFRVCLPTPYAIVTAFIDQDDQRRMLSIIEATIADEIDIITTAIPRNLIIQFDVALEVAVLEGAFTAADGLATESEVTACLLNAMNLIPTGTLRYLHTCYGDYHHTHFTRPRDLGLCVKLANVVDPDLVSMPADRMTGIYSQYHSPLRKLKVDRLALGVIAYTGQPLHIEQMIDAAIKGSDRHLFAVATECGLARITEWSDGPTLDNLLELHARFSTPIR